MKKNKQKGSRPKVINLNEKRIRNNMNCLPTLMVDNTKFSYDSNTISFKYKNEEYHCTSYIPHSDLKESDYMLEFLESAYYESENDIHSIYIDKKCVGAIIPLSFLAENDSDVIMSVKPFFQKYADVGIRKILSLNLIDKIDKYDFTIDELFPNDNSFSVFIYDIKLLEQQKFMGYLPSLYDAGYSLVKELLNISPLYLSEIRKKEIEEKKSLKQVKIRLFYNTDYSKNQLFYDELFQNILPHHTNPLFRYIMLYQIIEIFSSYASYNLFIESSEKYGKNQISRNDLREELHKSTNEKKLINKIYENIPSAGEYYDIFNQAVKDLFDIIDYDYAKLTNYGEFMYAMRNRIVHETRSLTKLEHMEKMKNIVDLYEKTIILLLKDSNKIKMSSKKVKITK